MAVLGPFVTCLGGLAVVSLREPGSEYGLGWVILHIAAFGVLQLVWILPVASIAAVGGRKHFAYGLLAGATMLLIANGLAWIAGLWLGAV